MGYKINNKTKKISLIRGDTLRAQVEILKDNQVYTPQVGETVRFAVKQTFNSLRVLINKQIPIDTLILKLDPSDTKRMSFGKYVYDIEITFSNGDVDTFITGEFEVLPEVI